ncbi:MAG: phosphatidylserine decarboxylase [Planctomycetota bacterium]
MKRILRYFGLCEWAVDEVLTVLGCTLAVSFAVGWAFGPVWCWIPVIPGLLILCFFRDPERDPPGNAFHLVSPADGNVTDITRMDSCEFIDGPAVRIGIFMSPLVVHVNRSPVDGTVVYRQVTPGKFLAAYDQGAYEGNERISTGLECPQLPARVTVADAPGVLRNLTADQRGAGVPPRPPVKILVRQIAGVLARRVTMCVPVGTRLARGQRFGIVKFGSRAEVYVPVNVPLEIQIRPGQNVRAGETVLAIVRESEPALAALATASAGATGATGAPGDGGAAAEVGVAP